MSEKNLHDQIALSQQSWHGWGSPVGLSVGFALVILSTTALTLATRRRPRPA